MTKIGEARHLHWLITSNLGRRGGLRASRSGPKIGTQAADAPEVKQAEAKLEAAKRDLDPDKSPPFIGKSVAPYVYFSKPSAGPDAGKFVQAHAPQSQSDGSSANPPGANK